MEDGEEWIPGVPSKIHLQQKLKDAADASPASALGEVWAERDCPTQGSFHRVGPKWPRASGKPEQTEGLGVLTQEKGRWFRGQLQGSEATRAVGRGLAHTGVSGC